MQIYETDLFKYYVILMTDRNKIHFDELKDVLSMHANLKLDNSGMIRSLTEFFYDHRDFLPLMTTYILEYKGFILLERFSKMVDEGKSPAEIESELGMNVGRYEKMWNKHDGDLSKVKETELFNKYGALLLDVNKKHFDTIRKFFVEQTKVRIDNSVLVRAFTEFLYERQDILPNIVPYCVKFKGFSLLENFMRMIQENRTPQEIEERLGISVNHIAKIKKRHSKDNNQ